jgi:hypothetical protein
LEWFRIKRRSNLADQIATMSAIPGDPFVGIACCDVSENFRRRKLLVGIFARRIPCIAPLIRLNER